MLFGQKINEFKINISKLDSLSPLKIMSRGYSLVTKDSKVIKEIKDVKINDNVNIELKDGHINAKIIEIKKK